MYKLIDELLERSKEGDKASKEELLNKLRPLIISSINKYYPNARDYEDLIQDGYIVILQCIEDFDPAKGVYFLGFVKTMLKYNYLQNHKIKRTISLNVPVGEDNESEMVDLLESKDLGPVEILLISDENKILKDSLRILGPRQRQVIWLFYVEGLSIGEIAKGLNISYRTVVNSKTKALKRLKKEIEREGL